MAKDSWTKDEQPKPPAPTPAPAADVATLKGNPPIPTIPPKDGAKVKKPQSAKLDAALAVLADVASEVKKDPDNDEKLASLQAAEDHVKFLKDVEGATMPDGRIRVRAIAVGSYPKPDPNNPKKNLHQCVMRRPGEDFTLLSMQDFSGAGRGQPMGWMELYPEGAALAPLINPANPPANIPQTTISNQVKQPPGYVA